MTKNRRDFLKTALVTGALLPLSSCASRRIASASRSVYTLTKDDSPIATADPSQPSSLDFNGDDIHRPHDILWNVDGYLTKKGGEPTKATDYDFVVVGGGMSGLLSAYYLRKNNADAKILIVEQDPRFGGNSKGETFITTSYSMGAAYVIEPDAGSPIEALLTDLGVVAAAREDDGLDMSAELHGAIRHFWKGETAPQAKKQFVKVQKRLEEIGKTEDLEFGGALCKKLDGISFAHWLKTEFGTLHVHLLEFFQLYGWSAFCGSIEELSAFQYLNFICFEFGKVLAFPGGNAAIARALVKSLKASKVDMESGALVMRVTDEGKNATVVYEEALGELRKVRAAKVVVACQKFVARKIVPQIPADQAQAIDSIHYRAYLVGNVILKKPAPSPTFDLWDLRGKFPPAPSAMKTGDRSFTDICFGGWAQHDQVQNSVLTLYTPLPYDGARQFLFNPGSHDKHKTRMLKDLETVLRTLGLTSADILGIRMTRWGHAFPLAAKGMVANGTTALASRPIGKTIVFANQDNFTNPAFETAHKAALEAAKS